jgi:acyl carrier protein
MINEIKERVRNLMAIVFGLETTQVKDNAEPGVIETWDSLRHMNLIVALEEEFEIVFTDEEMTELLNIELISTIISEKTK